MAISRDVAIFVLGLCAGGAAFGLGVWLYDRHRRARERLEQAERAAKFRFIGRFK